MEVQMADLALLATKIEDGTVDQADVTHIARKIGAKDDWEVVHRETVAAKLRELDELFTAVSSRLRA